ncbi:hypothetical protein WA026_023535 [Henosepilachna vigintioctopunctata]|uniref:CID domain-containing protein n=1 Tax=Henosepilachna vigintioctopunctata TaxID=420089 RepID=A0AAW1TQ56_9CUCU
MSEEPVKEFASNLADLCLSSEPLINMLTNLAGEYEAYAGKIVNVLEDHLTKIEAYRKLPALYVMDSIIKNIRGLYPVLFEENVVATYMNVYREVDLQTRFLMLLLRFSWSGIFSPENSRPLMIR